MGPAGRRRARLAARSTRRRAAISSSQRYLPWFNCDQILAIPNTNRARRASRCPHFLVTARFWAPSSERQLSAAIGPSKARDPSADCCPKAHLIEVLCRDAAGKRRCGSSPSNARRRPRRAHDRFRLVRRRRFQCPPEIGIQPILSFRISRSDTPGRPWCSSAGDQREAELVASAPSGALTPNTARTRSAA